MTHFHELPDSIEYIKLKKYFEEYILVYSNNTSTENIKYALSELLELADRQWNTYELLEAGIKNDLEIYLKSVISFEDEEIMDYILCIIPRIGLSNIFNYILQNKDFIHNPKVVNNILESENEYGTNIDNPYSGMQFSDN